MNRVRLACLVVVLITVSPRDAFLQKASPVITEASIRGHMEFLASDAMQGRGSGTDDEWRAATYIASQMRRWGIEPLGDADGYVRQIATGRTTVSAPPTLTIQNAIYVHGRDMLVQAIGAGSVSGPLVVFKAGVTTPPGSVVFVADGVTPTPAEIAGAVVVVTAETPQVRATWNTAGAQMPASGGGRGRAGQAPAQARIVLARETFNAVASLVAAGTTVAFHVDTKPAYTWDAIGKLTGTDPRLRDDVILLTAHLDHLGVRGTGPDRIYNGADDDASGSTAVLELCEALARGHRPKRTVIFAWFGSEESGGAGARDFLDHPPVPLKTIVANLEFEMIANRDAAVPPHTLWLTGYDCSTLGPDLAKQGARLAADPHPEQGFFARSDNIQLARQGVIAHTVSSFDSNRKPSTYHQPTDEIPTVDFAHMTDAIQSMLKPVVWLANSTYIPTWLDGKDPSKGGSCGARPGRGGGAGRP